MAGHGGGGGGDDTSGQWIKGPSPKWAPSIRSVLDPSAVSVLPIVSWEPQTMAPKKKEEPKPAAAAPPKPPEPERPKTPEFDPTSVTVKQNKHSNVKKCRETAVDWSSF